MDAKRKLLATFYRKRNSGAWYRGAVRELIRSIRAES